MREDLIAHYREVLEEGNSLIFVGDKGGDFSVRMNDPPTNPRWYQVLLTVKNAGADVKELQKEAFKMMQEIGLYANGGRRPSWKRIHDLDNSPSQETRGVAHYACSLRLRKVEQ